MSPTKDLRDKMSELELIASWASQTGFGRVRDLCRQARHEIGRRADDLDAQYAARDAERAAASPQ